MAKLNSKLSLFGAINNGTPIHKMQNPKNIKTRPMTFEILLDCF
jgi:hypothetical protein